MLEGILVNDKVIAKGKEIKEFFEKSWYGELKQDVLELDLIEAAFLMERGRLEIELKGKKLSLKRAKRW